MGPFIAFWANLLKSNLLSVPSLQEQQLLLTAKTVKSIMLREGKYMYTYSNISVSHCLPLCLSICLSVCLSVCLSTAVYLSACLCISTDLCLFLFRTQTRLTRSHRYIIFTNQFRMVTKSNMTSVEVIIHAHVLKMTRKTLGSFSCVKVNSPELTLICG